MEEREERDNCNEEDDKMPREGNFEEKGEE